MNKKAIELSVNFMVVLIITLVVFGMALYLLKLFFGTAQQMKQNIDTQTEREIQRLLFTGEMVAIPINQKEIKRGSSEVFGLGILNVNVDPPVFTIKIKHGPLISYDNTKTEAANILEDKKLKFVEEYKKTIKNNEHVIVPVPVRVPRGASIGTYILDLCVFDEATILSYAPTTLNCVTVDIDKTYDGAMHKIYVNVN